jgi:hypothetical protein
MKYFTTKLIAIAAILMVSISAASAQVKSGFDRMALEKKIRKEINMMPYYDVFDLIEFRLSDSGEVTLSGLVNEGTTRKGAANRIKRLPGVTNVVNNVELSSLSNFDAQIRRQTLYALASAGRLGSYLQGGNPSMRILVDDGKITLAGYVSTKQDADLAYITARGVQGAFAVTNNLIADKEMVR